MLRAVLGAGRFEALSAECLVRRCRLLDEGRAEVTRPGVVKWVPSLVGTVCTLWVTASTCESGASACSSIIRAGRLLAWGAQDGDRFVTAPPSQDPVPSAPGAVHLFLSAVGACAIQALIRQRSTPTVRRLSETPLRVTQSRIAVGALVSAPLAPV